MYDIGKIRELDSGKIRKARLARSALTFAVSVAVKPATKHATPMISINNTQIKHELRNLKLFFQPFYALKGGNRDIQYVEFSFKK